MTDLVKRKIIDGVDWPDPDDPHFTEHERGVLLAMMSLAEKGKIVDSGRKQFSAMSGQMEIVWVAAEFRLQ
jgi:hypothetical protein